MMTGRYLFQRSQLLDRYGLENAHLLREASQRQSTHIPMQKVVRDALHTDNIHMQKEKPLRQDTQLTLKESRRKLKVREAMLKDMTPLQVEAVLIQKDNIQKQSVKQLMLKDILQ